MQILEILKFSDGIVCAELVELSPKGAVSRLSESLLLSLVYTLDMYITYLCLVCRGVHALTYARRDSAGATYYSVVHVVPVTVLTLYVPTSLLETPSPQ